MLRSSQEACTHPKRWPPPRPRACWGGKNRAKHLQVTTKCDRSHRPPSFLPCLKKKGYLEDIFLKIFWPCSNRGKVHRLPESTQKGWRAFTQNIFQLRFWFFNYGSGLFEKSFFFSYIDSFPFPHVHPKCSPLLAPQASMFYFWDLLSQTRFIVPKVPSSTHRGQILLKHALSSIKEF